MESEKRFYRKLKRAVKRAGNKRVRQQLKRTIVDDPEEAAHAQIGYGRRASAQYNGLFRDGTRKSIEPDAAG